MVATTAPIAVDTLIESPLSDLCLRGMIATNKKRKKVVVLSFGAGQDSTALLYLYLYDLAFRKKYVGDALFIVVFSDTGNEHPRTMMHVAKTKQLCEKYNIPFFHIVPEMGFHNPNWRTLTHQYERNSTIGMKGKNKKACTFNLKIEPIYRFLSSYLIEKYNLPDTNRWAHTKAGLVNFTEQYGQIDMIIGIGAGEETRIEKAEIKQKWMRISINRVFPLVDLGMDRIGDLISLWLRDHLDRQSFGLKVLQDSPICSRILDSDEGWPPLPSFGAGSWPRCRQLCSLAWLGSHRAVGSRLDPPS